VVRAASPVLLRIIILGALLVYTTVSENERKDPAPPLPISLASEEDSWHFWPSAAKVEEGKGGN